MILFKNSNRRIATTRHVVGYTYLTLLYPDVTRMKGTQCEFFTFNRGYRRPGAQKSSCVLSHSKGEACYNSAMYFSTLCFRTEQTKIIYSQPIVHIFYVRIRQPPVDKSGLKWPSQKPQRRRIPRKYVIPSSFRI